MTRDEERQKSGSKCNPSDCRIRQRNIRQNFHGIAVSRPQGTYMLFIDCEEYCITHNVTMDELLLRGWKYGVYWQDGRPFHGEYSIRINLALPFPECREPSQG